MPVMLPPPAWMEAADLQPGCSSEVLEQCTHTHMHTHAHACPVMRTLLSTQTRVHTPHMSVHTHTHVYTLSALS